MLKKHNQSLYNSIGERMKQESLKAEVYEQLKIWDKRRAQTLKKHLKAVEDVNSAIAAKISDSKEYLTSLQTSLEERINQLVAVLIYQAESVCSELDHQLRNGFGKK